MRAWRWRERGVLAGGAAALALATSWAAWPLAEAPPIDADLTAPAEVEHGPDEAPPLDRAAFAARIWNPPPAPSPAAAAPAAVEAGPPPRLRLIGIAHDSGVDGEPILRAALYDPDTDKLHLVASGEHVGGVTVSAIDGGGVSLDDGGRVSRLALRDDPGGRGR